MGSLSCAPRGAVGEVGCKLTDTAERQLAISEESCLRDLDKFTVYWFDAIRGSGDSDARQVSCEPQHKSSKHSPG